MQVAHIMQAWGRILSGRAPTLSIEITRECPLRCPGCYAYDAQHLGGNGTLRELQDFKGERLIQAVLAIVDEAKPLHLSIVGGDPLVRYRELDVLLPQLSERGIHVQVVTSAFRPISAEWMKIPNLMVAVSIDGLQPEHDERRKPATYERILANIRGRRVTVHCTVTAQMTERPGYLEEFMKFWSAQEEVQRVWFSLFTPQRGDTLKEILTPEQRRRVVEELTELKSRYPKMDVALRVLQHYLKPPKSPDDCIFAMTTRTISADLRSAITPCQFGGEPDCEQCGCMASAVLSAVGAYKVAGPVTAGMLFKASHKIGKVVGARRPPLPAPDLVTIKPLAAEPQSGD